MGTNRSFYHEYPCNTAGRQKQPLMIGYRHTAKEKAEEEA